MRFFKQLLFVLMLAVSATAQAEIQAGQDYGVFVQPLPTHSGNKIEVLEFFFYGCSHCYHLHPLISAWEKKIPKDVELTYIPVIFNASWESMARTFYALEMLGQQKRLHDDLFAAWNINNMQLDTEASATDFVAKHGVDREKFSAEYNSFSLQSKIMRSNQMVQNYGIRGTPSLIVDGKYIVTGKAPEETMRILNELLLKVRKEHTGKKK
jgi:thiol:disulfide interchange protein DsbA